MKRPILVIVGAISIASQAFANHPCVAHKITTPESVPDSVQLNRLVQLLRPRLLPKNATADDSWYKSMSICPTSEGIEFSKKNIKAIQYWVVEDTTSGMVIGINALKKENFSVLTIGKKTYIVANELVSKDDIVLADLQRSGAVFNSAEINNVLSSLHDDWVRGQNAKKAATKAAAIAKKFAQDSAAVYTLKEKLWTSP